MPLRSDVFVRRPMLAAVAASFLLLVGAVGLGAWTVWDGHQDAQAGAERVAQNVVQALEQDIARNVELYDATLQDVLARLRLTGLTSLAPELRQAALFGSLNRARSMTSVVVTDERGDIVYEVEGAVPRRVNFADRDYFQVQRDRADAGLYASRPFVSRLSNTSNIGLSRRVPGVDGRFGGIVVAGIQLAYFQDLFARLDLGVRGLATLARDDGVVLARWPYDPAQIGRDIGANVTFQATRQNRAGLLEGPGALDGIERIFAYRHVEGLPFVITVGLAKDEVFAPWRRKAAGTAAMLLTAAVLAAVLAAALQRELRRRRVAEQEALQAQQTALMAERAACDEAVRAHRSEAKLGTYLDHLADGVIVARVLPDGRIVYERANAAAYALLDLPPGLVGREPHEVLRADYARSVVARTRECVEAGQAIRYERLIEDAGGVAGQRRVVDAQLVPVRDPDQDGRIGLVLCSFRDVTRLSEVERQLLQSQRMEAVGQLTAGVAHDFNNLLQAQMASLDLLLGAVPGNGRARRYVEAAIDSAEKGARLTHSLLSFSRKQVLRPEAVDAPELLARLRVLLSRTLDPRIALRIDVEAELAPPLADPAQLEAALLNLCLNARDAMGEQGGALLVEACGGAVMTGNAPQGVDPVDCVVFAVADEGCGMDAATLARVCEPFFTTKSVGKGSGLGLSMVQGFARQSGGELRIESVPGVGTRVEIWLPRAPTTPGSGAHRDSSSATIAGQDGTGRLRGAGRRVLLVDDNPDIRELLAEALERTGFEVVQAEGGEEALEMLRRSYTPFDALVTDYAMPGITGGELVGKARRLRPGLPAMIITGYAEAAQLGTVPQGIAITHKPFRAGELTERLTELVEAGAPAAEPGAVEEGQRGGAVRGP